PHPGVPGHLLAVDTDHGQGRPAAHRRVEPDRPPHDHEADGQPLDVPLPGSGQRLVEVVEAEGQVPLGVANSSKLSRWASPQACTVIPVTGVVDRSWAITAGAPRRNANGEARMRAARSGPARAPRCRLVSSSGRSGDGRPAGSQTAWLERGTTLRSSRPASARAPATSPTRHRP